jgi:light-regulated signal transduction histidine kinase (bacteriophytochrome)
MPWSPAEKESHRVKAALMQVERGKQKLLRIANGETVVATKYSKLTPEQKARHKAQRSIRDLRKKLEAVSSVVVTQSLPNMDVVKDIMESLDSKFNDQLVDMELATERYKYTNKQPIVDFSLFPHVISILIKLKKLATKLDQ